MRKLLLTTVIVATSFTLWAQNNSVQDYIKQYKNIAINEMVRTGVPASITLAQGILESGSGNSKLAKYSNNHFGIKCKKEWNGETVYQDDDIKNECFRVYKTAEDSYKDHSDFLKNRPYYTALFELDPKDYQAWAKGLKKAGYATERDYPTNLISLIEKYNLEQYSEEALTKINNRRDNGVDNIASNNQDASISSPGEKENDIKNKNIDLALFNDNASSIQKDSTISTHNSSRVINSIETDNVNNINNCTLSASTYPKNLFKINGTRVIYVTKGSSLFALASKREMSYNKLLDFNDLESGTDILKQDRLIYLEKKPKKGEREVHLVANGETLDEIAQIEGVQLNSLAEYNHINIVSLPLPGENIYLRTIAPNTPRLASGNTLALH